MGEGANQTLKELKKNVHAKSSLVESQDEEIHDYIWVQIENKNVLFLLTLSMAKCTWRTNHALEFDEDITGIQFTMYPNKIQIS